VANTSNPSPHFVNIRKIRKHLHVIGDFLRFEKEQMKAQMRQNGEIKAQNRAVEGL
jgi:hypothetical protein